MAAPATRDARFHVLLVGVDDYTDAPLGGCVNDIDAVAKLLLGDRVRRRSEEIRRLASPARGARRAAARDEQPATLDNLRAALAELGSNKVSAGDRVFIYYSGHGARVPVVAADGRSFHREALVPADYDARAGELRLLFDYELNELLRAIAARTRSVGVVLDCCHSAGATRDGRDPDRRSRFLDLSRRPPRRDPAPGMRGTAADAHALIGAVDDCHVVSACLGHELAKEERGPDQRRHGLLTRALLTALEASPEPDLATMTWGRIWQAMCAHVRERNPWQHPSMIGSAARAVFGGPPVEGDAGLLVSRTDDGYRIAAGTLADITEGAELAIYGEQPAYFPPLGSRTDHADRIGLVRVGRADRATATATAVGAPFDLPAGARGRLVKAGAAARLTCAVVPGAQGDASVAQAIAAQIAASRLLVLVEPPGEPEVTLEYRDGRWLVTDSLHGGGADGPVLFALMPTETDCARAVLEHYHAYARPLRLADRAGDLPGGLALDVLSCPAERVLTRAEAQAASAPGGAASLALARSIGEGTYTLRSGARVCFRVRNESVHLLRVTLLNSAASGKVQLLGDEVVEAGAFHVFWAGNTLGAPFEMSPPEGSRRCIDRMVAIGRTALAHDLRYLQLDTAFADVVRRMRDAGVPRDIGGATPIEHWTSVRAILETHRSSIDAPAGAT